MQSFIDDLQSDRIELNKARIYDKFPTFRQPAVQMALVAVAQSVGCLPALENLMREEIKGGLNQISRDFGVNLIISALQDEVNKKEIVKTLQNPKIILSELESVKTGLDKRFNELKVNLIYFHINISLAIKLKSR